MSEQSRPPIITDPNGDFGAQYIAYTTPGSAAVEVHPVVGWGPAGEGWPHLTPVITGVVPTEPTALPFDPDRRFAYGPTKDTAVWSLKQRGGEAA